MYRIFYPLCIFMLVTISGCALFQPAIDVDDVEIPPIEREFRAVWIATVANIDWPSQRDMPVYRQKAELREMFDRVEALNMNAVIFQVRPATDALYQSELEPWSEYLTGKMGQAPEPFYDPLEFAVEEAHRRGLELHAWFNPFRARHPSARSEIDSGHVSVHTPEIVREYGRHLWLDPGMEDAHNYSIDVILDVVRRYDVDGVHLDDYFYPYKERDSLDIIIDFPDSTSYARYLESVSGEPLEKNDWRRNNVDRFIERLYKEIKNENPKVQFGISPIGIWRPGYPEQIRGFDAYEEIYADARKWFVNGWLDYFTPQLYWPIDQEEQSYPVLLNWWHEQNQRNRHLWPGNFTSRVTHGGDVVWPADEIIRQIYLTRLQDGATGNVHFSMRALIRNTDKLIQKIDAQSYSTQALVPASPWLSDKKPSTPTITTEILGSDVLVTMAPAEEEAVWLWVIRSLSGNEWNAEIIPGWKNAYRIQSPDRRRVPSIVTVSAVNRVGAEGPVVIIRPDNPERQRIAD